MTTDDELDLLASAYLDGEATPEEVARVERDPELLARVEEFQALSAELAGPPAHPPALRERHLAAALQEFEALGVGEQQATAIMPEVPGAGDRVVDLRQRAASGRRSARARGAQRTLPSWLPAAAVFLLLGGGVIWAASRTSGSDDTGTDAETAAVELADDDASGESGAEEAAETEALQTEAARAAEAPAAGADEAAGKSEAAADAGADEAAAAEEGEADGTAAETLATPGLPPMLVFDEVPDPDTLEDLPEPEPDLTLSRCAAELEVEGLEPVGFVPIEIAGEPAELHLLIAADGAEVRLLVDDRCTPLGP